MHREFPGSLRMAVLASLLAMVSACDTLLTELPRDEDLFDAPLPGLTHEEQAAFARGDEAFGRLFSVSEGLGPIFNDRGCAACHSGDGRGRPENALTRIGEPPDMARELGGPQIQIRAIAGAIPERVPENVPRSVRLPPPVFGVGLIEAIPDETILARADPDDADGDGISGRASQVNPPSWVPHEEPGAGPGPQVGRFGRKAQVSSLLQQTVEAYHQDIGITTDFLPEENENPQAPSRTSAADPVEDPELPASEVQAVVEYLRMLAPPAPGDMTPRRLEGEVVFHRIGCASCHTPQLTTGPHRIEALAHRPVELYSDLLLHDMGDDLADHRNDGSANGREWRTAPLWGLRIMRAFLGGEAFLLHDGRAHSVEEAILHHGGEAATARQGFELLNDAERAALLDFVGSR